MKTRSIINKTLRTASTIYARISSVVTSITNEVSAVVVAPRLEPRRVRVPVSVQQSEFFHRH